MAQTLLSRLELLMGDEYDQEWFHNEKVKAETRSQHAALVGRTSPPEPKHITIKSTEVSDDYYLSLLSDSDTEHHKPLSKKSARHIKGAEKPALLSAMMELDPKGRVIGQLTDPGEVFCPILAVSRLPYKFLNVNQTTRDIVSQKFFASGRFWDRRWTVHYIHPPYFISPKPQFLVPSDEVTALLEEINRDLDLKFEFPDRFKYAGFRVDFPGDGTPRPRFLGISSSRIAFVAMEKNVPTGIPLPDDHDAKSKELFNAKMLAVTAISKNNNKKSKDRKKVDRIREKMLDCRALKRTQRYFGLRPREQRADSESSKWNAVEKVDFEAQHIVFSCQDVDVRQPVTHPFESDILFVCIDIEADELNHSKITEIGVSTLDTRDLVGVAPGEGGVDWRAKIRARHFRINEYKHLVNSRFLNGCPDRFEECFGSSEFIRNDQAKIVARSFFVPPFTTSISQDGFCMAPSSLNDSHAFAKRTIVLVGHDIKTDINYLKGLGYDPVKEKHVLEVLDTSRLYRALKYEQQPTGLANVMASFDMMAWNLHNAGNDAAYTLQALVAIVFKAATQPGDFGSSAQEKDNEEEWKAARADSGDGGMAG